MHCSLSFISILAQTLFDVPPHNMVNRLRTGAAVYYPLSTHTLASAGSSVREWTKPLMKASNVSHVPAATPDPHEELLARLRDLVPSAFPDGELDQGALLQALDLTEEPRPSFSFTWPGIAKARAEARAGHNCHFGTRLGGFAELG